MDITPNERQAILDNYQDVTNPTATVDNVSERRQRYEKLMLDYLERDGTLPNRAAFQEGKADHFEIPFLREPDGTPTRIYFSGPYGVGGEDLANQLKAQLPRDESLLKHSKDHAHLKPLQQALADGAISMSTERARDVLEARLTPAERATVDGLSASVRSTYFRADQSAIARGVEKMLSNHKLHRISTERFVDPNSWNDPLRPNAIAEELNGAANHPSIVIATHADDKVLEEVAARKHLPVEQVLKSAHQFEDNVPALEAVATHFVHCRFDGQEYRIENWRDKPASREAISR